VLGSAGAGKIDQALGDPRSWIAGGTFRLRRVPGTASSDFTIHLATRGTSAKMCAAGGTDTESRHQFGHGHELCPGSGRPAPVMEQQTLGVHGCVANPWPYLDGRRYAGPPGHY
jgi:hypothetical protein